MYRGKTARDRSPKIDLLKEYEIKIYTGDRIIDG